MDLSEILRNARTNKGMTMQQLAEASGISASTIYNYEAGNAEPTFLNLCCIAQVLNLSLDYLAGKPDEKTEDMQNQIFALNSEIASLHRQIQSRLKLERECVKILRKKA